MSQKTATPIEKASDTVDVVWKFLFGSLFRFLIILGVVLLAAAVFWAEKVAAGHLGIYGVSAFGIGVVGRVVVWWQVQDEY